MGETNVISNTNNEFSSLLHPQRSKFLTELNSTVVLHFIEISDKNLQFVQSRRKNKITINRFKLLEYFSLFFSSF